MVYNTIALEVSEQVATITLRRPDRLNAFTFEMGAELVDAFDSCDADDEVRAVIVTGAGRGFCAGMDLAAGGASTFAVPEREEGPAPRDEGGLVTLRIFASTKPVIAAINGPAVGVGATMTLPMDIRLISETARMGFVFAARGIVPDAASSWFLPRLVGISQAQEWVLTARVFPASEALASGLVRSVHRPEGLLEAARTLAREIAANTAPVSASISRQLMWRMLGARHPMEAHRVESLALLQTGRLPDSAEGIEAFLAKRSARWTGRPSSDTPDWDPWWEEPTYP